MRSGILAALLLAAALPVHAELYKWVDAKGVTNYSSTPPTASAKATVVEDRISVVPTDPSLKEAAAASAARPDYATEEWLQRQRLMALKDSTATAYTYQEPYYPGGYGYYPGYAYPTHPVARARAIRAGFAPVVSPHAAVTVRAASGARGTLTR